MSSVAGQRFILHPTPTYPLKLARKWDQGGVEFGVSGRVGWSAWGADTPGILPPPPPPPLHPRHWSETYRAAPVLAWPPAGLLAGIGLAPQAPIADTLPIRIDASNLARHQPSLAPSNPTLSSSCHLACAALFTSARLGCPTCRDLYDLHAHVHPIDFPTRFTNAGNPSSPSVPRSRQLPPEPVPFPAVSRCRAPVVFPGTSSGRVLSSWRAAALPQSCFFVSPTQQSRGSWSGTQPPPGALLYTP